MAAERYATYGAAKAAAAQMQQGWADIKVVRCEDEEEGDYWVITCQRFGAAGDRLMLQDDGYVR